MSKESPWLTYGRYGALGFEFAGAVIAGILLGRYLDEWLGTTPWAMLLGAIGGLSGAIYRLVLVLQQLSRRGQNARED
ncbi:MAG: AtpZ/AtpI family protein [Candidatus Binatia bacterium]|nr:AtpZ/AtpI family protein [Candidatus Binatia bacterium]